jgi:hypothetical protein
MLELRLIRENTNTKSGLQSVEPNFFLNRAVLKEQMICT